MTRLLIVDDSALMRRLLTGIFTAAGDFEIAAARSGEEALALLEDFTPDVITLDINMPGMGGLACLDRIMLTRPLPVVMVSSLTAQGTDETLEALALGAVDFIEKPRGAVSLEIDAIATQLVDTVRAAARARISPAKRLRERVRATLRTGALRAGGSVRAAPGGAGGTLAYRPAAMPRAAGDAGFVTHEGVVLVGCSTGGPPALDALLGELPADFPWPIVIAQHMPASFTGPLAQRLDRACAITVSEVCAATALLPGHAYIGRGDADVVLSQRGHGLIAMPAPSSAEHHWHPSVERLVASAMRVIAPERLVGVLMTGMGTDGADAMTSLKQAGGRTIAEARGTAVVWGMPGALVARDGASIVKPLDRIADTLVDMLRA